MTTESACCRLCR